MPSNYISLVEAARKLNADPATVRRALNRFALNDKRPDGQRIIPPAVVALFSKCRASSGYLYPRNIVSREELLAAAQAMRSEH